MAGFEEGTGRDRRFADRRCVITHFDSAVGGTRVHRISVATDTFVIVRIVTSNKGMEYIPAYSLAAHASV